MTWRPDYVTLAQLKSHLRITDTADDLDLAFAITAASRAVDQSANRQFGLTGSAVARIYDYHSDPARGIDQLIAAKWSPDPLVGRYLLEIDDLQTTVGLVFKVDRDDDGVYEETLTSGTDFDLWPWNAPANGDPWTMAVLQSGVTLPSHPRGVQVTANWGWTLTPEDVKQATLIQGARFFSRRNAPFGIAGSPDLGSELRLLDRLDPDVALMVRHRKRHWVWR